MLKTPSFQRGFVSGNIGAGILFVSLIVFVLWFMSANSVKEKIQRICRPAYWLGNVFVSAAELGGNQQAVLNMQKMRDEGMDMSCRYMVWKQFYYEDWLRAVQEKQKAETEEMVKKGAK